MPQDVQVFQLKAWEQFPRTVAGRVYYENTLITQATISAISMEVRRYSRSGGVSAPVAKTSLTVADVVFDTLQTDAGWTQDATGYNFKTSVPAAAFADSNRYNPVVAIFLFTPTANALNIFPVICNINVESIRGATA
jgi:hypothetical protein